MKHFITTSRIFLLSAGILLLASCAASLTDYGYLGGPNDNYYSGTSINDTHFWSTHSGFGTKFPNYSKDVPWKTAEIGYSLHSLPVIYGPNLPKGKVVTQGESLSNYFVFPEYQASYKSYYFKIASEVVFDYDGKTDTFKKCVFLVGAFPNSGNQRYGVDSVVVYNQPRKKMKIEGRLRCEGIPGANDDIFLDYKIKFNPNKRQNCYTESRVR